MSGKNILSLVFFGFYACQNATPEKHESRPEKAKNQSDGTVEEEQVTEPIEESDALENDTVRHQGHTENEDIEQRSSPLEPKPVPSPRTSEKINDGLEKPKAGDSLPSESEIDGPISSKQIPESKESNFSIAKMAILGDSIATGVVRDTTSGSMISIGHPLFSRINLANSLLEILQEVDDLYKQSMSFHSFFSTQPEGCESLACRLNLNSEMITNLAISGSKVPDVEDQFKAIPPDTDLIAISVGGNDFCSGGFDLNSFR
ncbi:MAG: hypothetical protein HRU09_19395 [Oligoflexales bacterium]|nr:hypothetical protein [Oligoflexales bacterium]